MEPQINDIFTTTNKNGSPFYGGSVFIAINRNEQYVDAKIVQSTAPSVFKKGDIYRFCISLLNFADGRVFLTKEELYREIINIKF